MAVKKINILGLSLSHCTTVCLVQNGKATGSVSEERFNRQKNYSGYPILAINYLLKSAGINGRKLDAVVVNGFAPLAIEGTQRHTSIYHFYDKLAEFFCYLPFLKYFYQLLYGLLRPWYTKKWREKLILKLENSLKIEPEKVFFIDHHLGHAYAPLYGFLNKKERNKKWLVFTNDGMGDNYCTRVNIFQKDRLTPIGKKTNNNDSLALIYTAITRLLGMKPLEHEYKVMGLAPYADKSGQKKSLTVLEKLVWLNNNLAFTSLIDAPSYYFWLRSRLEGHRFDWIAGAVQKLTETLLLKWIKKAIEKTKVKRIVLGGGIFMNVKANMLIAQIPTVKAVFMPSATDESTAIGAAYWGYQKLCQKKNIVFKPQPLTNLYLGPAFSEKEVEKFLTKHKCFQKYKVKKIKNMEKQVARLLSQKKIVARFAGRMEWGARALGNRSILAHPSDPDLVRTINEQIKGRDFWMPFAPTILYERQDDYLVNPKHLEAPFMVLAFPTTEKGKKELKAAIHPYDFTCRPQILRKEQNPGYYQLIKEFEKLTGIGAVLNTSFNLHGSPVVCSPEDALYVFKHSGLKYLALENFLICKE